MTRLTIHRALDARRALVLWSAVACALLGTRAEGQRARPVLGEVTAARIVSSTRALVLDRTEARVHLVDERGFALAAFGRPGGGPRELRTPERLERFDASHFGVLDRANGRVTLLRVESDSIRFVGTVRASADLHDFCRAGRVIAGAVRGDTSFFRVTVLNDSLQRLRAFGVARAELPPPVRARLVESRLGCLEGDDVIAAEFLGPVVTRYAITGRERWQTVLPNHRSINIVTQNDGTRFEYPRTGHHSTLEVLPLEASRIAVSLAVTYMGPIRDTATQRGTIYELDAETGRVLSARTGASRLRDARGPLRLYDFEDPEPRVEIVRAPR